MENKKLANLKFSVIVIMFYYLTLLFMTSSTPPGPYDDGAPNSAFILENGQTLG